MKTTSIAIFFCVLFAAPAFSQYVPDSSWLVLREEMRPPEGLTPLGSIKIGDRWRSDCNYEKSIAIAKEEAAQLGGNIIKITKMQHPDIWSTCYRLSADIYYAEDLSVYRRLIQVEADSILKAMLPDTVSYALLCMYREYTTNLPATKVHIFIDGKRIYSALNGLRHTVRLSKPGKVKIWTDIRRKLDFNIEAGKIYFVRCHVDHNFLAEIPRIEFADPYTAVWEFLEQEDHTEFFKKEKKDFSVDDIYR
ncbi:MAG: hypothetical protein H3C54_13370 [Taibaiella sp.]|nr:hypothetical protein [Taibaiella sp.]